MLLLTMEPHPIPQNVTNFQFHLVGDMTLKQFGYLASGSGFAYILFVFFSKNYPVIVWPTIVISTLLGFAFAFLPISSRPLDSWVSAFFKAIYSPTKRSWKKNNKLFKDEPLFNNRLLTYLSVVPNQQQTPSMTATFGYIQDLATPASIEPQQSVPSVVSPTNKPKPENLAKTVNLAREAQNLQFKIIKTERVLGQIKQASQNQTQIPVDYSQQVNQVLADLQTLVNQASEIKSQLETVTKPENANPDQSTPVLPSAIKEKIKVIIPTQPKQTQLALTTFPNVISGVVKDKAGNYLIGTVAVIYDKEGLPVRALKTNKLGQFTGSTPLPSGVYTLELEKDNFNFDVLQIELNGEILPPLMITAKN